MKYYDLLMRRVYNRIAREMLGLRVWVVVNTYGVGTGRQVFEKGGLNYMTPGAEFRILPVSLDIHLLDIFAQWMNYGNLGSSRPEDRLFSQIEEAMEILERYPV